jgi:acylphosphatase
MENVSCHITVKGFVQGVGFRYFVNHHAIRLGLKGYVKNLYEGDVEVLVEGDKSVIEDLLVLLKVGPRSAKVTNVMVEWMEFSGKYNSFNITF